MSIDPVTYARRWKTLAVLSLSLVIIGLDNTILNIALPSLQDEFSASRTQLQWMVDSYLLAFAGLLLVFGTLSDRLGRKLGLQIGISIFGLASLAAPFAGSSGQLIAVRAAMGVGAALIMPATLSIIANLFTGEERRKAIGIWAALAAVGIGLGPLAGGLLLEWFDWWSVFMVNVPFAVIALALGIRYVPESRDPRPGSFDVVGAILSTAGFTTLVYAIVEAPGEGWLSGLVLGSLAGAVALLAAFIAWERHTDDPMLELGFFRSAQFSIGTASVSLAFFALLGGSFALTQYLQFAHGYSAIEAGAIMSPMALGLMLGAGTSSKASDRLGASRVITIGLAGLAVVLALTALWSRDTSALADRALVLRADAVARLGHGSRNGRGHRLGAGVQVGHRLGDEHRRAHGLGGARRGHHRIDRQLALLGRRQRLARRHAAAAAGPRRGLHRRGERDRTAAPAGRPARSCSRRPATHIPRRWATACSWAPRSPRWQRCSSPASCRAGRPPASIARASATMPLPSPSTAERRAVHAERHSHAAPRRRRRRWLRRAPGRPPPPARAGLDHPRRPAELHALPAARLPGRHRRALGGRDHEPAAGDRQAPGERERRARRGRRARPQGPPALPRRTRERQRPRRARVRHPRRRQPVRATPTSAIPSGRRMRPS